MIVNTKRNLVSTSAWFYSCSCGIYQKGIRRCRKYRDRERNAVAGEIMWGRFLQILFSEYLLYQIAANLLQLKRTRLV